jgi:ubiquinone/menaquinone biosynthesis C-methylase UbiE
VALVDPMRLFPGTAITRQQILDHLADFDLARLAKGDPGGLSPRLQFVQRSICDTGFADGSVDVTFSNSVLEHLPDIDQFLTECARITRPGGFGVHGIDVADHRRYSNPSIHALEFLTEERTDPILHECNRLRLGDHERKFAEHGFEILTTRRDPPIDLPADLRARFVEPWRSLPDDQLNVIWCQYLVRRR